MEKGELFGETMILERRNATASIIADGVSPVDVYYLEEQHLNQQEPAVRSSFYQYLACILAGRLGKSSSLLAQMPEEDFDKKQAKLQRLFRLDPKQTCQKGKVLLFHPLHSTY